MFKGRVLLRRLPSTKTHLSLTRFECVKTFIPWHTSESRIEQSSRTWFYHSCTYGQSQELEDHQGSDL